MREKLPARRRCAPQRSHHLKIALPSTPPKSQPACRRLWLPTSSAPHALLTSQRSVNLRMTSAAQSCNHPTVFPARHAKSPSQLFAGRLRQLQGLRWSLQWFSELLARPWHECWQLRSRRHPHSCAASGRATNLEAHSWYLHQGAGPTQSHPCQPCRHKLRSCPAMHVTTLPSPLSRGLPSSTAHLEPRDQVYAPLRPSATSTVRSAAQTCDRARHGSP
mmetsp:Transcript_28638/g.66005  ORF Transcript_28638/g.66005 Transcript_28638/m.66005 type:complete len:219 (+) Transcript_28638:1641-2297(+)